MVEVQLTDGYKQLERLLVCLRPSDCIEGLFSVLQRVLDKIYEAFGVVAWLKKHHGVKLFRITMLAEQC